MATVKFISVGKDGTKEEITDLYWFEEQGVHSLDDRGPGGERVEVEWPRCDGCAYWFDESDGVDKYRRGTCRKRGHGMSTDPFADGFNIWTDADFGCVKFEAK